MREGWSGRRALAGIAAIAAGLGLAIQLALTIGQFADQGLGIGSALWRFAGYFTLLTNAFVLLVASAMVVRPDGRLAAPVVRLSALVAILLVGIVYSLALRHIWEPEGWQKVADHLLHDASPILFALAWLAAGHGTLGWRHLLAALVFPLTYLAYAIARGAWDGWYAYYFLDPAQAGWDGFVRSAAGIAAAVSVGAAIIIEIDRALGRRSATAG